MGLLPQACYTWFESKSMQLSNLWLSCCFPGNSPIQMEVQPSIVRNTVVECRDALTAF